MGVSTDGQICIGIVFEEDYLFPWDEEKYDGDIEEWWLDQLNYEEPFTLFDEVGEFIGGVRPDQKVISEFFEHKRNFLKANPLPVELVNYQSASAPAFILAVPGTLLTANRGYPEEISEKLSMVQENAVASLIAFCEKYCQPNEGYEFPEMAPKWTLSSYWGE